MAAGSKSGKRRALIAVDDPAEARRIIAELERDGYECLWARTHGEMERIALEEPNLSIAHIAHDFTGGLAADPSRPRAPRPVDLQYFDPPVAAEIAPRASRIHEAIPGKTARVLIVDDRPKKAARLRESLAGHSWLVPVTVTTLDGLAAALAGGVEVALVRMAFEGGRGLRVAEAIVRHDATVQWLLYTDRPVDPDLLDAMKGKLLDERRLIRDRGRFVSMHAVYCFSKREVVDVARTPRRYDDRRMAEEAAEVLAAFRMTKTVQDAALYLGVSDEELRERMRRHGIDAPS